LTGQLRSRNRP